MPKDNVSQDAFNWLGSAYGGLNQHNICLLLASANAGECGKSLHLN